ncbi:MAG: TraB/GumN family protein [Caulobacteraceae bacterium]
MATLTFAGAALALPPVWHVEEPGGGRITLFGSVHLLSDATRWRSPALDADLASAGAIWFEIPIDAASQAEAGQLALEKGMLPKGQTLDAVLPPELYARAAALAAREGLPGASLQRLRPWMAELTLSLLYFQKQGARADLGVEDQLSAAVPPGAQRGAFETVAGQIDLFADDPLPEQIASLRETLDEIDKDPAIYDRLAKAWSSGDVQGIEREAIEPMQQEDHGLYERLIVDRNRRFASRIAQLAHEGRNVFVVVGVGHLVGADGVPALLRQDGLKVEGP